MTQQNRTIRLFVSSTFSGMKAGAFDRCLHALKPCQQDRRAGEDGAR